MFPQLTNLMSFRTYDRLYTHLEPDRTLNEEFSAKITLRIRMSYGPVRSWPTVFKYFFVHTFSCKQLEFACLACMSHWHVRVSLCICVCVCVCVCVCAP